MQKKRLRLGGKMIFLMNVAGAVLLYMGACLYWSSAAVPAAAMLPARPAVFGLFSWKEILGRGIPGLHEKITLAEGGARTHHLSFSTLAWNALDFLADIDRTDIRSVLRAELPLLASIPAVKSGVTLPEAVNQSASVKSFASGEPLVGIYHTHTAESFLPSTGVAHRPGGQVGEICTVGAALAETLEKNGIPAVQDTTIHDFPSFMKAYGASEVTLKKMVEMHPSLQMVFDVHRDAEKRENVIAEINGEITAKVSIIVAQGQEDLPQPHWQENYALAKRIDQKCNEKYPGLLRGIQLVEWRYNQHLHPHALLLEVGSHETSMEESVRAMQLMGDVLAEILREGI